MEKVIILTGSNGHLGNNIVNVIKEDKTYKDCSILGLTFKTDERLISDSRVQYIEGDVRDKKSLRQLFEKAKDKEIYVIHCASLVSIENKLTKEIYETNVIGTQNILDLSLEYKVKRYIHVSSVHTLSIKKDGILSKQEEYYPSFLRGGYSKSKALANNLVLDYIKNKNLNGIIVMPSGIIGPNFLNEDNNLIKTINKYIRNELKFGVKGGYDFVDVRDVTQGILASLEKGKIGETYILSNKYYSIKEIFETIQSLTYKKKTIYLPISFARLFVPFIKLVSKIKRTKPLFTSYSLYVLRTDDKFDYSSSRKELSYSPRDIKETLKDTISYIKIIDNK